jgi:hypothetical protein
MDERAEAAVGRRDASAWRLGIADRTASRHQCESAVQLAAAARRGMLSSLPSIAVSDESLPLIPITVTSDEAGMPPRRPPAPESRTGIIEIVLPSGERLRVDAWVDEPALRRVLAAIRGRS